MSGNIREKMKRGAAWMVLFKLAERSLGLLSMLVLVRVLTPEDFGIVAMAISFIAVAELISSFGFDLALIHKQDADEHHYNTAWTCNVLLGVAVMAVMVAAADPIASFYKRPEVFWVVCALALGPAIGGAENIGVVAFRKELDFKREFRFLVSKKILSVAVTIPLALWLRSYWALVAGTLFSRAAGTLISYLLHPFRPRLSLSRMSDLMSFSRWILINNVILTLKERTTDFIIGSMQGPRALGLYNIANEFATLPHTELASPVNRALIPSFAKLQGGDASMQGAFIAAVGWLGFIVVPAALCIHSIAPYLVPVLFGSKWLDATAPMQVLAIAGGIIAMHSPICALLVSHGHPGRVGVSHVCYVAILMIGLVTMLPLFGVAGAAAAVLLAAVGSTPAYLVQLKRGLGLPIRSLLHAVQRPVVAAVMTAAALHAVRPAALSSDRLLENLAGLAASLLAVAVVYLALLWALWRIAGRPAGPEQSTLERVRHQFSRPAKMIGPGS